MATEIWVNIGSGNGAWRHQAITWSSVQIDIRLRAISQEMPWPSINKICLKITYLNFHSNFPGANELKDPCFPQILISELPLCWAMTDDANILSYNINSAEQESIETNSSILFVTSLNATAQGDLTDDKSTWGQKINLSESVVYKVLMSYGITKPQWVNKKLFLSRFQIN